MIKGKKITITLSDIELLVLRAAASEKEDEIVPVGAATNQAFEMLRGNGLVYVDHDCVVRTTIDGNQFLQELDQS